MLNDEEVELLNKLFVLTKKKMLGDIKIAALENHGCSSAQCDFYFSWGFESYCSKQEAIDNFLKDLR